MKKRTTSLLILTALTLVSACTITGGSLRRSMGIDRDAPDEFMVLTRKKLEMPDNMALPTPGSVTSASAREASVEAREEVFGVKSKKTNEKSELENAFNAKLARFDSDSEIRAKIKQEAKDDYGESLMNSVIDPFGYNRGDNEIIDVAKENTRVKKLIEKDKAVTGEDSKIKTKYKKL